jgi:hypothetical protein
MILPNGLSLSHDHNDRYGHGNRGGQVEPAPLAANHRAVNALRFRTELQRKNPDLPVFIRIPGAVVVPWKLTEWTTVEGTLNGHDFGRRTIKARLTA